MKKFLALAIVIIFLTSEARAEIMEPPAGQEDNPGYFVTPGFLFVGGTRVYARGDTHSDREIRPVIIGMLNLLQTEYGNLGLTAGGLFTTPSVNISEGGYNFNLRAMEYTGEVGLAYSTGSKTFNLWLGGGYNASRLTTKLRNVSINGQKSSFEKRYRDKTDGFFYYAGLEYLITKDGRWGLSLLFRGQESNKSEYDIDENTDKGLLKLKTAMDISHQTYVLGLTYHF